MFYDDSEDLDRQNIEDIRKNIKENVKKEKINKIIENRTTIQICSKDRHSELALCLQSLRTNTYQDWDLILLDESQTPITQCYFLVALLNRLKLEGHKIKLLRNDNSQGVCYARQKLVDEDSYGNPLTLRLDDDCILSQNYIEKLLEVIDKGFDMASGVVPLFGHPSVERENRFVKPIINEHKFDKEGNIILQKDELGYCYLEDEILPTHQYRTNCLYFSKINKDVEYQKTLSMVGFREEGFHSFKAILKGYTIGINLSAKAYHLNCQSGGVKSNPQQYAQNVKLDNETFLAWCKKKFEERGDFLAEYNGKVVKC